MCFVPNVDFIFKIQPLSPLQHPNQKLVKPLHMIDLLLELLLDSKTLLWRLHSYASFAITGFSFFLNYYIYIQKVSISKNYYFPLISFVCSSD